MDPRQERAEKLTRLRALMEETKVEAIWLRRISSFAWLTAGAADHVGIADEHGIASLLVTPDKVTLLTNNIESPRLQAEEGLAGAELDWQVFPWHEPLDPLALLPSGARVGADEPYPGTLNLVGPISALRSRLLPPETDRMRELGRRCGAAMTAAISQVAPGTTELQIAGLLACECYAQGVIPVLTLVGADERVFEYRHPIPTDKTLSRYAMLALGGRRHGLVASLTRFVHFGPLPKEVRQRSEAVAKVDATLIAHTRPGAHLADIFRAGVEAYSAVGYRKEWHHHHQGGTAGYEAREEKARPASASVVYEEQAYAWNPSIAGTKSEDTIIVGPAGNEVATVTPGLPVLTMRIEQQNIMRPAIWEKA